MRVVLRICVWREAADTAIESARMAGEGGGGAKNWLYGTETQASPPSNLGLIHRWVSYPRAGGVLSVCFASAIFPVVCAHKAAVSEINAAAIVAADASLRLKSLIMLDSGVTVTSVAGIALCAVALCGIVSPASSAVHQLTGNERQTYGTHRRKTNRR